MAATLSGSPRTAASPGTAWSARALVPVQRGRCPAQEVCAQLRDDHAKTAPTLRAFVSSEALQPVPNVCGVASFSLHTVLALSTIVIDYIFWEEQ